MTAEVRAVTAVDEHLRRELLAVWTDVTNAGGAVGFVPPVTEDDIAPTLDDLVRRVREGRYKFHDLDTSPLKAIVERWHVE